MFNQGLMWEEKAPPPGLCEMCSVVGHRGIHCLSRPTSCLLGGRVASPADQVKTCPRRTGDNS